MRSRLWTGITLSATALAVIQGCRGPDAPVWVDIRRAAQELQVSAPTVEIVAPRAESAPGEVVQLPELRPISRGLEQLEARRREALRLVQAEREQTSAELEAAYEMDLLTRAKLRAGMLEASLSERTLARADAAVETISQWIRDEAPERGRLAARFALIVGLPDRGPASAPRIARTSVVEEQLNAEAKRLRAKIEAMDADMTRRINAIVHANKALGEVEREHVANLIETEYRNAAGLARERAQARLRETGRLDLPSLLSATPQFIPGRAARELTIPAAEARLAASERPQPPPPPLEAVKNRLNIWLRVRGYKLANGPRFAPDKTGEFVAWSKHR